jgi:hypothetical protein
MAFLGVPIFRVPRFNFTRTVHLSSGTLLTSMLLFAYGTAAMPPKAGYFTERGVDPFSDGKKHRDFYISKDQIRHYMRYGPSHRFFDSLIIPYILLHPTVIFQGLKRENMEKGLCYSGVPTVRYINADVTAPPHPGMTFLVFADDKFRVFDWRWEKVDKSNNDYPLDSKDRFTKTIWSI